jgi:septum site-determining protein MinD
MGAKVVTVTSGKGGVGKTTTTANLGVALARMDQKIVLIDADIGLRNLDIVMGLENRIVYDLVDIVEGRCKLRQALIKHKMFPDLYLIPAAQTRDKTAVSPADMIQLTDQLRQEMDFILIDSPAGIERGFRNAVAPADEVLIVTNPEVSAVRDADRVIGLLEAENKKSPRLILNRAKLDQIRKGEMMSAEDVTDILAIKLIGIIPEDDQVVPSSNSGVPITLTDGSRAGQAFRNIARRLMGEEVPFMTLDEPTNLIKRIGRLFTGGKGN